MDLDSPTVSKTRTREPRMANSEVKASVPRQLSQHPSAGRKALSRFGSAPAVRESILTEEAFHTMLTLERRRAERSRKPFVLMVIDTHAIHKNGNSASFCTKLASIVSDAARETDIIGWHKQGEALGVIFTEINLEGKTPITEVLHSKVVGALHEGFELNVASSLIVTVHLFPENWDNERPDRVANTKLYPDLSQRGSKKRLPMAVKRAVDLAGSALLLLIFSPILAVIAIAIKLTSKGPVIFKQNRVGQFGAIFPCFKFRTMHVDNDPKIHRDYVRGLIAKGVENEEKADAETAIFKITNDPRVTAVGRFLRKTSLDEFPQFWNVLCGDMSLVGPRPPVPYEFEVYDFWHRRRVLEVKPGVTGLWQVCGRSRTCFDDMVRLDLQYSRSWSLWLDIKILLATPRAVITGEGAY
jgi:lipopolysaccharide/colanic/teichoic acid biosynthesis glycosyltransferase